MSDEEVISSLSGEPPYLQTGVPTSHQGSISARLHRVGDRLRAARIAAGLTQQELAGQQFSKSYISAVERGKMTPSLAALSFLADQLDVSVSLLLGEGELDMETLAGISDSSRHFPQNRRANRKTAALLRLSQAEAFIRQDQPRAALECLGERDGPPPGLPASQHPVWYWLAGWAATLVRRHDDAIRFLEQGLRLAQALCAKASPSQQAPLAQLVERLRYFLGFAYCNDGQTMQALEHHLRGLTALLAHTVTEPELTVLIYRGLGNDYLILGRYQEAIRFYQEAIKHLEDFDHVGQRGPLYWGLGLSYQEYGDWYHARAAYQQALEAVGSQENWPLVAQVRILLGEVLTKLEQFDEAESQLYKGLEGARRLKSHRIEANALLDLAALSLARGLTDEALQQATAGLEQVSHIQDPITEGQLHLRLAEVHVAQRHPVAAEQALQKALEVLQQGETPDLLSQAHEQYGRFLNQEERYQEAYEHLLLAQEIRNKSAPER